MGTPNGSTDPKPETSSITVSDSSEIYEEVGPTFKEGELPLELGSVDGDNVEEEFQYCSEILQLERSIMATFLYGEWGEKSNLLV